MTLPSPDDREAVANWIDSFGLMDDHANDIQPDHPIVRAIQRLVSSAVKAEREACARVADDLARRARAASNEHGWMSVTAAEHAEAVDLAAALQAETIALVIRARKEGA